MKSAIRSFTSILFVAVIGTVSACGGDDSTPGGSAGSGGSGGSGGSAGAGGTAGTGGSGDDAGNTDAPVVKITSTTGDWNIYTNPYGDGGAGPVTATLKGSADAFPAGMGMRVKLTVTGLPPNRPFGSHIHKLDCNDNKAGTHYQNMPAPDGGANDPMYANNMNEVWLDFTTDATGAGSAEATVQWVPRAGEAKSVVIHDMATMTGGLAGAKLACISMPF